ncbi:MAG: response regulator transcription factor [Solirubrobacteraceae bacterium]
MSRVLVIDDDEVLRGVVRELLQRSGHDVGEAADGKAGLRAVYARRPDLVILDVEMPELDGWQTLERIRELSDVPVLMLTAREAELERVRGLQGGADDYVVKPFGRQELVARVQALLRRAAPGPIDAVSVGGADSADGGRSAGAGYADGRTSIDFAAHVVRFDDRLVELTPLEFKLLAAFVRHPNQVLSHDQLLELVWGDSYGVSPDQVKLYVGYLRRKLSPEDPGCTPVQTVRGFGYRYRRPD